MQKLHFAFLMSGFCGICDQTLLPDYTLQPANKSVHVCQRNLHHTFKTFKTGQHKTEDLLCPKNCIERMFGKRTSCQFERLPGLQACLCRQISLQREAPNTSAGQSWLKMGMSPRKPSSTTGCMPYTQFVLYWTMGRNIHN